MHTIFKKEYRLSLLLILVFGTFLATIDKTSMDIIYGITGIHFHYEKRAFLKITYWVLLFIAVALLFNMDRTSKASPKVKGVAYRYLIVGSVISFFPGWIIHLYAVIHVIETKGSFMVLQNQFWLYNAADLTLFIGFCSIAAWKIMPVIHPKEGEGNHLIR